MPGTLKAAECLEQNTQYRAGGGLSQIRKCPQMTARNLDFNWELGRTSGVWQSRERTQDPEVWWSWEQAEPGRQDAEVGHRG